jgi:hypothetical protein
MALKDPATFKKGATLTFVWLIWFFGGAIYAALTVGIPTFLNNIPADLKLLFLGWVLVSTILLYLAIVLLIRGMVGRREGPHA